MLFTDIDILATLDRLGNHEMDSLTFGVIRMDAESNVVAYNACEFHLSGLSPARVMGKHFFRDVAPCTNNSLVAFRFYNEPELDGIIDYVFTLRMRATTVKLRPLRSAGSTWQYLLVNAVATPDQL